MQRQIVCSGCRTLLLYPTGATNICCVVCNVMTPLPPTEMERTQSICGGCHMLIPHTWGATSVRCSCCQTMNLVPATWAQAREVEVGLAANTVGRVNCPSCGSMLMYPGGAPLVKCAICSFVTNVRIDDSGVPNFWNGSGGFPIPSSTSSTSTVSAYSQNQTIVVQNPATVDENGKLVRNLVVGITT